MKRFTGPITQVAEKSVLASILLMAASAAGWAEESSLQKIPCLISQDRLAVAYPLQKTATEEFEKLIQSIGAASPRNALERIEKVQKSNSISAVKSCGQSRTALLQTVGERAKQATYLRILDQGKTDLVYKLPKFDKYAQPEIEFSPSCNRIVLFGSNTQPVLFELGSGSVILLPTAHGEKSYSGLTFSEDSKIIARDEPDLKEIDLNTGKTRTLLSENGLMRFACPHNSGRCRLAIDVSASDASNKTVEIQEIDVNSGQILSKQTVTPPQNIRYYGTWMLPDGTAILRGDSKIKETWILPEGSNKPIPIPGENPVPLSGGKVLTHQTYGTDAVRLEIIDLAAPASQPVELKLPMGVGIYQAISDSQGGAVIQYGNNFGSSSYFSYHPDGKSEDQIKTLLNDSAAPDVKITQHRVQSTDGFEYPAYFYHKDGKSKGVVVFVHGGGCHARVNHSVGPGFYGPEMLQVLDSGYDVFAINYRNDTFEGYYVKDWTKEECGTKEIDDIVAANRYVREKFPDQPVFLYGHSQGAYLANLTVTQHAADAKWNGVITGAGMWQYRSDVMPDFMETNYHPDRAPLDYIDHLKTPMLLFHGRYDQNVAFEHAEALMERIGVVPVQSKDISRRERWKLIPQTVHSEFNGVPIDAYLPDKAQHHLLDADQFQTFSEMTKQFLDEHR